MRWLKKVMSGQKEKWCEGGKIRIRAPVKAAVKRPDGAIGGASRVALFAFGDHSYLVKSS